MKLTFFKRGINTHPIFKTDGRNDHAGEEMMGIYLKLKFLCNSIFRATQDIGIQDRSCSNL